MIMILFTYIVEILKYKEKLMSVVTPSSTFNILLHHLFSYAFKMTSIKFSLSTPSSQMTSVILGKVKKHLLELNPGTIKSFHSPCVLRHCLFPLHSVAVYLL